MGRVFPAGAKIDFQAACYELAAEAAIQWKIETTQLERGRYECVIQAVHTEQLQLAVSRRSIGTRLEGQIPVGTVVLAFSMSPGARVQFRGRLVGEGELIVQEDTRGLDFSYLGGLDIITIAVTHDELSRRAQAHWGRGFPFDSRTGLIRFTESLETRRSKRRILECLLENIKNPEVLARSPEARRLENQVLDSLFCGLEDHAKAYGTVDRHRAAKKALDLMHDAVREEISLADLCEAVGTNRRTLHQGFLELYGISPMRYLRVLRLCKARREILRSDDPDLRVTDVALAWGFTHLGRFAGEYRELFGELPSAGKSARSR